MFDSCFTGFQLNVTIASFLLRTLQETFYIDIQTSYMLKLFICMALLMKSINSEHCLQHHNVTSQASRLLLSICLLKIFYYFWTNVVLTTGIKYINDFCAQISLLQYYYRSQQTSFIRRLQVSLLTFHVTADSGLYNQVSVTERSVKCTLCRYWAVLFTLPGLGLQRL